MIGNVIALLTAIFQAIPILNRWFTKTAQEKIEDGHKDLDQEQEEVKKSGRPPA